MISTPVYPLHTSFQPISLAMASFIGLPTELKDAVFADLAPPDLTTLSMINKNLRREVTPLIYQKITLIWDSNLDSTQQPKIVALLRTLLDNPTYATHIKSVQLHARNYQTYAFYEHERTTPLQYHSVTDYETALIGRAVEKSQIPGSARWTKALCEDRDLGATIALTIAQLHNLEFLTMDPDLLPPGCDWFCKMLTYAVTAAKDIEWWSRCAKLYYLGTNPSMCYCAEDVRLSKKIVTLPFYLPALTTLELWAAPDFEIPENQSPTHHESLPKFPLANHLTTIRLRGTTVSTKAMKFLLKHSPRIQELVYDCNNPSSRGSLPLKHLREGLAIVSKTLKRLEIRCRVHADEALEVESLRSVVTGSLGSLRSFDRLTHLKISFIVLFGETHPLQVPKLAEMLPPNLEVLTISDDLWGHSCFFDWDAYSVLLVLSEFLGGFGNEKIGWKIATPILKRMVFAVETNGFKSMDGWGEKERATLKRLCEVQKLEWSIIELDNQSHG